MNIDKLQRIVIDALEDIKGQHILVFDAQPITSMFDRVVIASGTSNRQTRALAKNLHDKVKTAGGWVNAIEGDETGEWILVDLGDIVVHIMQPAIRDYYRLEEIWGKYPIDWEKMHKGKRSAAKKAAAKKPSGKKSGAMAANESGAEEPKVKAPATKESKPKVAATKKPAAKKAGSKVSDTKKPATKKSPAKTPAAKKPAAKKSSTAKPAAKKPAAGKTPAKKSAAKK